MAYNRVHVCMVCSKIISKKKICCGGSPGGYSLRQELEYLREDIFYGIRNDESYSGDKEFCDIKVNYNYDSDSDSDSKTVTAIVNDNNHTIKLGCPGEIGECTTLFRNIESAIKFLYRKGN